MHGKNVRDFQREVTGGCKIENVTGKSQEADFQRTLTRMCQVFDFITKVTCPRNKEDSIRKLTLIELWQEFSSNRGFTEKSQEIDFKRDLTGSWIWQNSDRSLRVTKVSQVRQKWQSLSTMRYPLQINNFGMPMVSPFLDANRRWNRERRNLLYLSNLPRLR